MKQSSSTLILAASFLAAAVLAAKLERQMNLEQGPDSVFDRPVSELMPELDGAAATGQNGRVGNELVFWSYRLSDGRDIFFYACAEGAEPSCEERRRLICPAPQAATLVRADRSSGLVRNVECRAFAIAAIGDVRPGCRDEERESGLAVGLVQCD